MNQLISSIEGAIDETAGFRSMCEWELVIKIREILSQAKCDGEREAEKYTEMDLLKETLRAYCRSRTEEPGYRRHFRAEDIYEILNRFTNPPAQELPRKKGYGECEKVGKTCRACSAEYCTTRTYMRQPTTTVDEYPDTVLHDKPASISGPDGIGNATGTTIPPQPAPTSQEGLIEEVRSELESLRHRFSMYAQIIEKQNVDPSIIEDYEHRIALHKAKIAQLETVLAGKAEAGKPRSLTTDESNGIHEFVMSKVHPKRRRMGS